ncbi:MAG: metal ABC transporter ATP-binding protein [Minisyncoccota bacterium]
MSIITPSIIDVQHLSFHYGTTEVLQDVSFVVSPGDYVGLVGGNGSGKTTLLRMILGLIRNEDGAVKIFDTPVEDFQEWSRVGYVPQNVFRGDLSFPATVEEIVASGYHGGQGIFRGLRRQARDETREALIRLDAVHLLKKRVGELSGGERQRVFIARSLVAHPQLLILDEPTSGIDTATEERLYALLGALNHEGVTIVLVSHDLEAIAREVKTVLCLNRKLVCAGNPTHLQSAEVLQAMYGNKKQIVHHGH